MNGPTHAQVQIALIMLTQFHITLIMLPDISYFKIVTRTHIDTKLKQN
jgi:hypothetical protein